jgi:phage baseplate assembly protein V
MSRTLSELSRLIDELICFGTIAEVDHAGQRLRLDLRGRPSGWLPYPNEIGQNFRRWCPLRVGTQVLAACPSGNPANAVLIAIIPTNALPPPSTAEGLDRVEFNDGSLVEYDSDAKRMHVVSVGDIAAEASGNITATAGENITATAGGNAAIVAGAVASITAPAITLNATKGGKGAATMNGSFKLKGDFEIEGNVAVTGNVDATGTVMDGGGNSNHHTHPGL